MTWQPRAKPAHYRGNYQVQARAVVAAANANPNTRCWRCRNSLHDCAPHRDGKPARWTAGHINDGQVDGELLPECSSCNATAGAREANRRSRGITYPW